MLRIAYMIFWLIKKLLGRDKCSKCSEHLDRFGYCSICNRFPYRKWLLEEESLFIEDEEFRRKYPTEYEKRETSLRKISVKMSLDKGFDTKLLRTLYGDEAVAEVMEEIAINQSQTLFEPNFEVGEGFRRLQLGEKIQKGDHYWSEPHPSAECGFGPKQTHHWCGYWTYADTIAPYHLPFRRKI